MEWSLLPNALQPFKIYCASLCITSQLVLFLWWTIKIDPLGHVRVVEALQNFVQKCDPVILSEIHITGVQQFHCRWNTFCIKDLILRDQVAQPTLRDWVAQLTLRNWMAQLTLRDWMAQLTLRDWVAQLTLRDCVAQLTLRDCVAQLTLRDWVTQLTLRDWMGQLALRDWVPC